MLYPVVIIGFVPDTYQVHEAEGVVTFMIELITRVLDKYIVVEFFTEDGSAEGWDVVLDYIVASLYV